MVVDPVSGEIRDEWLDPSTGEIRTRSDLERLQAELEIHGECLDTALLAEEAALNTFNRAESLATLKAASEVPATILARYVRAQCDVELAALTSAQFATKRARARVDQTKSVMVAEQSAMKWRGQADGGF